MTISSTVRIAGPFTGNGVTTTFPFTYKVFSTADVQVIRLTISTGVETTLTLVTDYNITLNGNQDSNPGGNIVMVTPLLALYKLTATSDIANLQPTDLTNQGGFYPEVITDALDRATIQIQQLADQTDRAIKIPISDGVLDMTTPGTADRASKYFVYDASGKPSVSSGSGTDTALRTDLANASASLAGSRLSGFRQTGTGATARTVDAKLKDTVSVKDFGAVGDGVADDTAAIQAAITANAGGSIYLPTGTYLISATINIPANTSINGANIDSTIFKQNTNFDVLKITSSANVCLSNFSILNTLASASVVSGNAIYFLNSSFCVIENVKITGTYTGLKFNASPLGTVKNLQVGAIIYIALDINNTFDIKITNSLLNGLATATACVRLSDFCDEMSFANCIMNGSLYALYTQATVYATGLRPEYCSFYNCSFDSTTDGVWVDNSLAFNFTNCFFSNRPGNGCIIGATNSESIIFENCIFFNSGAYGLLVLANAKHTVVNNCRFIANSVSSVNTYHGLAFAANTDYFTITNNLFKNGWGGTGSQGYGLVVNAGTSNYFQVSNNTFLSNGIGSMSLSVAGTIVYIKDNVGFLTRNAGTATITLGLSSVVVTHGLGGQPYSKDIIIIPSLIPTVAVYVSALTPTTFTISAAAPVAADVVLNWNATIFNG